MAIPFISNIGFTEVNSAGTLNDKAGTAKSKLPIQFFKLTDNISGNLTLNNDSAHKKIILDTNGNTILNSSGSPLTTNSNTTLELIGSGNVQSTLKTSTVTNTSTGHTGTTNFSNSNTSTIVVSNVGTDTSVVKYVERSIAAGNNAMQIVRIKGSEVDAGVTASGGSTPNASTIFAQGGDYFSSSGGTAIFMGDTSTSSGSPESFNYRLILSGFGPNTVSALGMHEGANIDAGAYPNLGFNGAIGAHNRYADVTSGFHSFLYAGSSATTRRFWFKFERSGNDRSFVFTNNLSISCVLSGADPFDGVTVSSGATATSTRTNSTDGSHDITMTISGNNGSGLPFALADVNSGTGSLDTSAYSGTLSTKAFS